MASRVTVLGVFVADLAFRAARMPRIGETLLGSSFAMGPGGKGSNQAVAAARAGATVSFISILGDDQFSDMAMRVWAQEGITPVITKSSKATGAAHIFIDELTGGNAIIVVPSAADDLSAAVVEGAAEAITGADVFVTQLEQPQEAALRALQIAKEAGVTTILNTAPVEGPLPDSFYPLCDFITPNETEAQNLSGIKIDSLEAARRAAELFLSWGVGHTVITLGDQGALLHSADASELVGSFSAGAVVETTGAGDAFAGAFAAALAEDCEPLAAVRFGCAGGALSTTRMGTAPAMPTRAEIDDLLASAD